MNPIIARALTGALFALCSSSLAAQSWPARPVRMIVPFAAGGGTDIQAHTCAAAECAAWQSPR